MSQALRLKQHLPLQLARSEEELLAELPGISTSLARRLIEKRDALDSVTSFQELKGVAGLGPKGMRTLASFCVLEPSVAPPSTGCRATGDTGSVSAVGLTTTKSATPSNVKRELLVDIVARLPQGAMSRAWGWLARVRRPKVAVSLLKRSFARGVGIDLSEAAAEIEHYETLEDMFVRKLRVGARHIDADPLSMTSPVDGQVGAFGTVESGLLLQVKGRQYRLAELLGDEEEAKRFEKGPFLTLYLAPKDYHRVHAPISGQISAAQLIPGGLLPVFPEALDRVDGLFARNERIITYLDTPRSGRVAVVMVGATLVGRMSLAFDSTLRGNRTQAQRRRVDYDPPPLMQRGAELGAFELGSTVVLVGEPNAIKLADLTLGQKVLMGQRIGEQKRVQPGRTRLRRSPEKP